MSILVNIGKLKDTMYVCDGCCCGHEELGNPKILHEFISSQIKENNLDISLEKPYCLGPCEQANVIKLRLNSKNYWFKRMDDKQDILDAIQFIKTKELTKNLKNKQMEM